jgi:two-component system nitrate/nitrite response regulator NarL
MRENGTILVIDDHALVTQGLRLGLEVEHFTVETSDGQDELRLEELVRSFKPNIVLLDLNLEGGKDGVELVPMLLEHGCMIVVLSGETRPEVLARTIDAGVHDILGKATPFPKLIREIVALQEGDGERAKLRRQQVMRDARQELNLARVRLEPFLALTRREEAVLHALMEGHQAAQIAEDSFVSLSTIRSQIRSVLTKTGVTSQLAVVAMALKAGWKLGGKTDRSIS